MSVMRFNFDDLQDFRHPIVAAELEDVVSDELEAEAEAPPAPTFSQDEIETAKKLEYQRGHADGLKDGREQAENEDHQRNKTIDQALQKVMGHVALLEEQFKALLKAQTEELSQLVLLIGQKVAGDAIATTPEAGIVAVVRDCLPIIMHQPKIQLIVHSTLADTMGKRMKGMIAQMGLECDAQVIGDADIDISECRLEWKDGAAERDMLTIWSQIEEKLATIDFTQAVEDVKAEEPVEEAPAEIAEEITHEAEVVEAAPVAETETTDEEPINEANENSNNNINKGENDE